MPPRNDGSGIACLFKHIRLIFYLAKTSNPSTIAVLIHATMPHMTYMLRYFYKIFSRPWLKSELFLPIQEPCEHIREITAWYC
ncbi:MAG: hypothetical protein K0R24_2209 [Gammaproteobacteria bacterium]|jgi:hypothetical protein|nr:hypothetical protein [Gammaproteobacteria bacterium]